MFEITTPDGHIIYGTAWAPDGEVRAVIQLFHGLGEHFGRYQRFAEQANACGIAVVAHNHRGHGEHAELAGHYADSGGWLKLIDDGCLVNDWIKAHYPDRPVLLLGHSMGSYIAQYFAMYHGERIAALILSASTWPNMPKLIAGRLIARAEAWRIGLRGKSPLLDKLGFGDFNRPFTPARTPYDWLSRDESEVDRYINDPLCGGPYTCGLWLDLLGGLTEIASDVALSRVRPDMPLLITAGSDDPVGGDKGITKLALHYAQSGHSRMTVKLFEGGRHEMFNETNRDEFSAYILGWIEQKLPVVARV